MIYTRVNLRKLHSNITYKVFQNNFTSETNITILYKTLSINNPIFSKHQYRRFSAVFSFPPPILVSTSVVSSK